DHGVIDDNQRPIRLQVSLDAPDERLALALGHGRVQDVVERAHEYLIDPGVRGEVRVPPDPRLDDPDVADVVLLGQPGDILEVPVVVVDRIDQPRVPDDLRELEGVVSGTTT